MSRVLRMVGEGAASLGSFVLVHGEGAGFRAGSHTPDNDRERPMTAEELREEAYASGYDEGRRTVEAEFAAERDALARFAEALEVLRPEPANALALVLAETVDRLVRQVIGEVEIDGQLLLARARAAALLVGQEVEPTKLRVNPDDIVHLEGARLDVALDADPSLPRGSIILETGHGWVEDGPAVRLERLRTELDKMAVAR